VGCRPASSRPSIRRQDVRGDKFAAQKSFDVTGFVSRFPRVELLFYLRLQQQLGYKARRVFPSCSSGCSLSLMRSLAEAARVFLASQDAPQRCLVAAAERWAHVAFERCEPSKERLLSRPPKKTKTKIVHFEDNGKRQKLEQHLEVPNGRQFQVPITRSQSLCDLDG
jgi:hypothetical protein